MAAAVLTLHSGAVFAISAMTRTLAAVAALLIAILLIGCGETPDSRLHELARASLAQQAQQNGQIARQAQQIAESVRHLVQADSQARQELLAAHAKLQQDLQAERVSIERQLAELEQERRQLAQQRGRDPIVANAISAIGSAIACLLPLLLAGYVLFTVNRPDDKEAALNQMLVAEFVAERPCLLPRPADPPRRLEHRPSAGRRSRLPKPASL